MSTGPVTYRRFNPRKDFKPGMIGLVCAKRNTGKSVLLLDLAYHFRHLPEVSLFSATHATNPAFRDIVPETNCHTTWDADVIRAIMKRQAKINKGRAPDDKYYHTLIIDDMASDAKFCRDPLLKEIFYNGRHIGLTVLVALQYSLDFTPGMRGMVDMVFLLRENIAANRKRLHEFYVGQYDKYVDFYKVFNKMTDGFGMMVVNNASRSKAMEDCVYHYTATMRDFHANPKLPRWRMGSKAYWAFHYQVYNKHWDSSSESESDDSQLLVFE